jgi:hypothetical protein
MGFRNTIFTRQLDLIEYENSLYEILDILKNSKVLEVEMLFGWAWGNKYKNWAPFTTTVEEIAVENFHLLKLEPVQSLEAN